MLTRPTEWGATGSQSRGCRGSRQSCQLGAASSHQHGAPASLLKDRPGRSLKDANVAADIWEILAGDQTRAENQSCRGRRRWGRGGTRERGPGLVGAEGNRARAATAGKAVFSDRPSVGGHWALCWKNAAEEEDAEGKGGGGRRMDMESPQCLGSPPNSRALSIIKPVGGGGNPQDEELWNEVK